MTDYSKILTKAAELYNNARRGDTFALAVENIAVYLSDEREGGRLDSEDNAEVRRIIDLEADARGFTYAEIMA